jgi:bcr-type benzoyl-CoA reductase subunit C
MKLALEALAAAANAPGDYARAWKRRTGGKVVGTFPMNFPGEIVRAAGALPVVVQDSREPITAGSGLLPEFHCGYTRSLADQAATGQFGFVDAFVCADHCIQLLGAVDTIRYTVPETPVRMVQFISSMGDPWARQQVDDTLRSFAADLERLLGTAITDDALRESIRAFNENRRLLRRLYELRRSGAAIIAAQLQVIVQSSMVMDVREHTSIIEPLVESLEEPLANPGASWRSVRLHLSGHLCHAPRAELLSLFEECGATVVDDDLYTGYRYISTDVPEDGDPLAALGRWYASRNDNVPCPTRVQHNADWDDYLLRSVAASRADGVVVLMVKFCEPHMLYYPELRKALEGNGIPLLLIETEHEGLPLESIRTRVETFIEQIRRRQPSATVPA